MKSKIETNEAQMNVAYLTPFPDGETAPVHPEVDKMAVHAIEAVAANAAVLRAEARACALRAVAVEMARVGRDPTAWRPEDATAAYSIAETLLDVQSSGGSA